jgi:hypothetical protein
MTECESHVNLVLRTLIDVLVSVIIVLKYLIFK